MNLGEGCLIRRVARGIGGFVPLFTQKFFNLLGFLRKKPENPPPPPLNFSIQKISKFPLKKFLPTPHHL